VKTALPGRPPGAGAGPEAVIREARRRQRRRHLTVGMAMAVVVAGAVAVIAVSGPGGARPPGHHGRAPAPGPGLSVPARAAATLVTASQTSLPRGNSLSLTAGYGAVWVTGIGVTYEVDQVTGRIVRTIPTPGTFPDGCRSGIAAGAGAVWVTHGCRGIYRIDPRSGRVTASLRVPDVGDAIAVADGLVWVTDYNGCVLRIRPRTGQVTGKPIAVGFGGWWLTVGAGALWVTSTFGNGAVTGLDLATGAAEAFGSSAVSDVSAAGAGSLWSSQVKRVDPATGTVTASIPVAGAYQVVFWRGSAWVLTLRRSLALLRIDPATNHVTGEPVPVGKPVPAGQDTEPAVVVAGPTGLWVLDFYRNLLFHLETKPIRS
jgi:DNA-binding beta-propeller fold protein YncE